MKSKCTCDPQQPTSCKKCSLVKLWAVKNDGTPPILWYSAFFYENKFFGNHKKIAADMLVRFKKYYPNTKSIKFYNNQTNNEFTL